MFFREGKKKKKRLASAAIPSVGTIQMSHIMNSFSNSYYRRFTWNVAMIIPDWQAGPLPVMNCLVQPRNLQFKLFYFKRPLKLTNTYNTEKRKESLQTKRCLSVLINARI